jgi:hypothetical protein
VGSIADRDHCTRIYLRYGLTEIGIVTIRIISLLSDSSVSLSVDTAMISKLRTKAN